MKVPYINPFLEAATYIIGQFQLSCTVGNSSLRETPFSGKEILTVVGMTGEIRGQVYLGIPMTSALKIVSMMMGGVGVSAFDSMAQSAITELSNMICGNAATRFSKEGIFLDITPPTLIIGKGMEVSAVKMRVLSIPIHIEGIESLEMNLVFGD